MSQNSAQVTTVNSRAPRPPPLISRQRDSSLPLSHAQQCLCLLEWLGIAGTAYHNHRAVRVLGSLDVGALAAEEHESHVLQHSRLEANESEDLGRLIDALGAAVDGTAGQGQVWRVTDD